MGGDVTSLLKRKWVIVMRDALVLGVGETRWLILGLSPAL
jgi:hypothetical protein